MIFVKLVVENFGVYAGINAFALRPQMEEEACRPIVLVGGKNGSGKTTILDAIRLCLYGRSALGNRVRQKDYELYIAQRIHRHETHFGTKARIQLVFEHTHGGHYSVYDAVRSWAVEGKALKEDISIFKDGQVLQAIPPDHWDDFLRDLIPPGVADLFFFDGEQIQALANDSTEAEALADAIRGLLNLELVERLNTDLNTYLRQQKQKNRTSLEDAARQVVEDYTHIEENILDLKKDRAHLMSQLDYANNKIEQARQALLSEGAGFIEERDALLRYRSELEQEIEHVHSEIRDMASGFLPFAIAPQWSKRLKRRLRAEDSVQREQVARDVVQSAATYLTDYLASEEFFQKKASKLSREEWHTIIHEINHALVSNETHSEIEVRHPVSEQTRHLLYTWIQEATEQVPEKLNTLSTRLETLEHERSNLERALGRVPDDLVAKPLLDDFQRWSTERGGLEEKIDALDVDIHKLKIQLAENERAIRQTRHELAEAEGVDTRIQRAAKAQVILDDYLERITQVKIEELENTFIQYFNRLTHKKGLVQTIRIDPRDFTTALYGANQTLIPKSDLSAGEKQLYAMALLWALRTVSGRVLPIIMDTPMGRLDIDHRAALIENFFPHVAHQVILLSTDSEIDAGAYDHIRNSVSHAYRLEYDGTTGYTRVIEGYIGCPELEALS